MKKIISVIIMMAAVLSLNAQQTTVEGAKLFDNTTVSVYGGGIGWLESSVVNADSFLEGVRPQGGVAFGKWFTPVIGSELFYEASAGSLPFNKTTGRWTLVDYSNLGLNAELNLNNLFRHYSGEPNRVEVVPFGGIGWGHGFTKYPGSNVSVYPYGSSANAVNFLTAQAGERIDFNMGKQKAWQINIRPSITWILAGEGNTVNLTSDRAYVALQVGLTYKFGHKNSTGVKTHNFTKAYTVAEYDALQARYNYLQKAYDEKPKEVEKIVEKTIVKEVPVEVVKTVTDLRDPHFVKNMAIVDATSIAVLDDLAETMKNNDSKYVITGYASVEGENDYNKALSLKRAEAIKECLVERGVSADRLETVAGGETDDFGTALEANRRVVISEK